jgi:hypothetical protein
MVSCTPRASCACVLPRDRGSRCMAARGPAGPGHGLHAITDCDDSLEVLAGIGRH